MKIETKYVNTPLKDYHAKIHWRNTMNFAACLQDNNPYYFDDEREAGVVAPPMFCVAVTWPIIENIRDFMMGNKLPYRVIPTIVHYSEHLIIHRLVKPGDELTVKGKIIAMIPHQAGTHIITRFETLDKDNAPVFEEYMGGMLRGVECIGEAKGLEHLPKLPQEEASDKSLWKEKLFIDKLQTFIYDGCAQIYFPIHTSKKFAHMVGLPDIILQGNATLAYAVREITNKEAKGNPEKIKEISCNYTGMVMPGTNIEIQLNNKSEIENNVNLFFNVFNNKQKKAIRNGYIKLKR